jgi:hypothetical protein
MSGAALFTYPKFHAQDNTGAALSGGLLYTYVTGTTTPKATYSDQGLTTANTNPVVLDSNGDATVYISGVYDMLLKTSAGVTVWSFTSVNNTYFNVDTTLNNVVIGEDAGNSISTGTNHVFIGLDAGKSITTASNSVAIGSGALRSTTTAAGSVAIGKDAGYASTSAAIVAVGQSALKANTTGTLNTAIGEFALTANTTGESNVAVGYTSLDSSISGSNNTAVGNISLSALTTGSNNTIIGSSCGATIVTGSSNTCVGYLSGPTVTTISYVTCIGQNADSSVSYGNAFGLNAAASRQYETAFSGNVGNGSSKIHYYTAIAASGSPAFTEIFLDGAIASARLTIAINTALTYSGQIVARDQNGNVGRYTITGIIARGASTVTLLKNTLVSDYEDVAGWDVQVTADDTNKSLKIDFKGNDSASIDKIVYVKAMLDIVEV